MKIDKINVADVKYLIGCVGKKGNNTRLSLEGVYIADEQTVVATNGTKLAVLTLVTGMEVGSVYRVALVGSDLMFGDKIDANYPAYAGLIPESFERIGSVNFSNDHSLATAAIMTLCPLDYKHLVGLTGTMVVHYRHTKPLLLEKPGLKVVVMPYGKFFPAEGHVAAARAFMELRV